MKTGYDQHFKKIKQTSPTPKALNLKKSKSSSSSKEKKSAFPMKPLLSFIAIAGVGLGFLSQFDAIESYLQKVEISMGVANAAEAEVKPDDKPGTKPAGESAPAGGVDAKTTEHVDAKKVDDTDYLFKLAERKKALDQREEDLNKVAAQIEKQKGEIAEKLAQLEDMRQKISAALQDRIKADDGKVDVLVQMYTNMKPQQAAKVFESLDEDLVIEILSRMKKKSAADILNLIKPEKAQLFAERYTGYRTPASNGK
ncbi:MAG: MotE family protein [Pseudobdellovibrio sp.]